MDDFALAFERVLVPNKKVKIQSFIELINYQPTEFIELGSRRVWRIYVYICKFFNGFVKSEFKKDFMKRVIVNGMTSRRFKRFEKVSIVVTDINKKSIVSS